MMPLKLPFPSSSPLLFALFLVWMVSCKKEETSLATKLPTLSTVSITAIKSSAAASGGNIITNGGASITASGVCWSTSENPTIGLSTKTNDAAGSGSFSSSIIDLNPNTLYYVRAYATNSVGTAYGNQISFSTPPVVLPTLSTTLASEITSTIASSGGNITDDGGAGITARGVCWSTSQNPSIALSTKTSNGSGTGIFTSNLGGLNPNTLYYVRAYATNSAGTAYGDQVSFSAAASTNPVDADGNTYNMVTIGSQVWIKENLKVSKYRNGDSIAANLSDAAWKVTTNGAFAIYNNDPANDITYGKVYNWYTISDPRGLCPLGWHVPTDHDWNLLTIYLDPVADTTCGDCFSSTIAGGKMKGTGTIQAGTGFWNAPNTDATNSSGFTGLPGGSRSTSGPFNYLGNNGWWWSSTQSEPGYARTRGLNRYSGNSSRENFGKSYGVSVRCLRD